MMCQRIGMPPTSTIGFGRTLVSSLRRVPNPPARMTAFTAPTLSRGRMGPVRRISVGIPAYNESRYIEEAITSVISQTRPADEILVFDNASTDGTDRIAARLLSDGAVRRASNNVGAAENFN